jgi:hypothetical protein
MNSTFHERVKERDFEYIQLITKIVKYCLLLKYPLFFKIFFYLKYIIFLFTFNISTLKLLKNIKKLILNKNNKFFENTQLTMKTNTGYGA